MYGDVPTGAGLFTFTDIDGSMVDSLRHAAAAAAFAREFLDSDLVLRRLLELVGM